MPPSPELARMVVATTESREEVVRRCAGLNEMMAYRISIVCKEAQSWNGKVAGIRDGCCAESDQMVIVFELDCLKVKTVSYSGVYDA